MQFIINGVSKSAEMPRTLGDKINVLEALDFIFPYIEKPAGVTVSGLRVTSNGGGDENAPAAHKSKLSASESVSTKASTCVARPLRFPTRDRVKLAIQSCQEEYRHGDALKRQAFLTK